MIEKMSQRDIKVLKIGAVFAAGILLFVFASDRLDNWKKARDSLNEIKGKLELIDMDKAKRAGLMSIVPVFEMPEQEETQRFLFIDKLTEQFKKAGIKNQPLQVVSKSKSGLAGYSLLRLECSAKCKFTQLLDLLASLKENPYLAGVEELRIRCDKKKPQDVDIELTVSTFVK
jgi:hypothetical protein